MRRNGPPTKRRAISRRTLLKGAVGATALAAAACRRGSGPTSERLIVNYQGGEVGRIFEETTIEPFAKKFGVEVIHDEMGVASQDYARIRASNGEPGFDVAASLTAPEIILGAKEGLLERISEDNVPNVKYMWEKCKAAMPPYGIVQHLQYIGLFYNHDKIARPESWRDYWAPGEKYGEAIKGRVLQVDPGSILCHLVLIMGARAGGGDVDNMEPAFEFLEAQRPYVGLTEQSSSRMAPYFENEEIWLSPYYSPRAAFYIERGFPMTLVIPREGTLLLANTGAVPIGSQNKRLAFEFLNFRLEREVQRRFCLGYSISPGRADMSDWPESFAESQITTQEEMDAVVFPDFGAIAANRKDWSLRWQRIMGA